MPTKYDPNHRQLQITNKYICTALKRYVSQLKDIAKSSPSFADHANKNIEGAVGLLSFMGLEPVVDKEGCVIRIRKCVKASNFKNIK